MVLATVGACALVRALHAMHDLLASSLPAIILLFPLFSPHILVAHNTHWYLNVRNMVFLSRSRDLL